MTQETHDCAWVLLKYRNILKVLSSKGDYYLFNRGKLNAWNGEKYLKITIMVLYYKAFEVSKIIFILAVCSV